jgi:hypothetical protein
MAIRGNSANGNGEEVPPLPKTIVSKETEDVAGPRFYGLSSSATEGQREAGDSIVYSATPVSCYIKLRSYAVVLMSSQEFPSWHKCMIRERVSTHGIIRPLEPESELDAFHVPQEIIGAFSELAVRRYLEAKAKFDKKFSGVQKVIDKRRRRNLELAKKDTFRKIAQLRGGVLKKATESKGRGKLMKGLNEGLQASSGWAWALESDERPPPSSIVSRRDTAEARQLARIADLASLEDETSISGNHLWSMLVDFLTSPPGKDKYMTTMTTTTLPDDNQNGTPTLELDNISLSRFIPNARI